MFDFLKKEIAKPEMPDKADTKETPSQDAVRRYHELMGDCPSPERNAGRFRMNPETAEQKYRELMDESMREKDGEFEVKGIKYETDNQGRVKSADARPALDKEGERDNDAQREAGGKDRRDGDDGGHLIAHVLGGVEGDINLVAMRATINRGDYKKMENEIAEALKNGKDVHMHIDVEYEGDSERPSKIKAEYEIDGEKREAVFENKENSTELLENLDCKIDKDSLEQLKDEIHDAKEDGEPITITSVKTEYDADGNPVKVTVGTLNEKTGEKSYRMYDAG